MPEATIRGFIERKQDWIYKHWRQRQHTVQPARQYVTGDVLPFFGKDLPIILTETNKVDIARLYFVENEFHIFAPPRYLASKRVKDLKPQLVAWYMANSLAPLEKRTREFAKLIGSTCRSVRLKAVTSIWGSCSPEQDITYNWKLALAPQTVSDYVIAHEVSHLVYKHHQRSFWDCVRRFSPEYKFHIRWLKRHGRTLSLS